MYALAVVASSSSRAAEVWWTRIMLLCKCTKLVKNACFMLGPTTHVCHLCSFRLASKYSLMRLHVRAAVLPRPPCDYRRFPCTAKSVFTIHDALHIYTSLTKLVEACSTAWPGILPTVGIARASYTLPLRTSPYTATAMQYQSHLHQRTLSKRQHVQTHPHTHVPALECCSRRLAVCAAHAATRAIQNCIQRIE